MLKNIFIAVSVLLGACIIADADPRRSLLTRENAFPDVGQYEMAVSYQHDELDSDRRFDRDAVALEVRYSFYENFTAGVSVPFVHSQQPSGGSESGVGDVVVALDLLAYEDIFDYPFVIPYVELQLPSGDDDKGLGTGETSWLVGISVGTVTFDKLTWVLDGQYGIDNGNEYSKDENVGSIGLSLAWDISDRFAVLGEGRGWEKNSFDNSPYQVQAGMLYALTSDTQLAAYIGQYREDTFVENKNDVVELRATFSF